MGKSFNLLSILLFSILLVSCNDKQAKKTDIKAISQSDITNSDGYKLMENKCFICHFKKPDPSKMGQMIAPPMLRVKEHYLPNYQDKEAFVKAVMEYVNNPSEDKTLMPGAVKKFNLMPKVTYDQGELKLIAEALYEYDFGSQPKMNKQSMGKLSLNNGERWKIKSVTIKKVDSLHQGLRDFTADKIEDYNKLGKDLFEQAKFIMLDKSYTDDTFNQIHAFFNGVEGDMHALIAETSIDKAEQTVEDLKKKFTNFHKFFEAE